MIPETIKTERTNRVDPLEVKCAEGEDLDLASARVLAGPYFASSTVAMSFALGSIKSEMKLSLNDTIKVMQEQASAVNRNDMAGVEAMLSSQAIALNAMFGELVRRSGANIGVHLPAVDTYMRLAMKAQNQCRMTLETLSAIKNPPVVYAKQANIAHGPQQVNYGVATRTGEKENSPIKVWEQSLEERMDTPAKGKAGTGHPAMAAVDQGNRAKDA